MLDPVQFRELVIRPVITAGNLWSPAAEVLMLGTGKVESRLKYLKQLKGGPALGLYQMEPATHDDIWENYLKFNPGYYALAESFAGGGSRPQAYELIGNLNYATIMARLHYRRVREPLPDANDLSGMARYWKTYYNTPAGAGTVDHFLEAWRLQ